MWRVLALTSNVGSLFEPLEHLHQNWLDAIVKKFKDEKPQFAVLHMQETGGKDYVSCSHQAPRLVERLAELLPEFTVIKAYLDIEHAVETFSALSQVFFVHRSAVSVCSQYNFNLKKFLPLQPGLHIVTSGLADHPEVIKRKFPKSFWPGIKLGRKGCMLSRWRLGSRHCDFMNAHLFHDESNIDIISVNPALYSENRKRAMYYVLDQLKAHTNSHIPLQFVFGDLNFRLHSPSFLNRITERSNQHLFDESEDSYGSVQNGLCATADGKPAHPELLRRTVSAIEFRRDNNEIEQGCVLRIEKKRFDFFDHKFLLSDWRDYLEDDHEAKEFRELNEFPIDFPPTYPWSEDPTDSNAFLKTRAPAWCDRVLMNSTAFKIAKNGRPIYESIGRNVCTGDHKPVALAFDLPDE